MQYTREMLVEVKKQIMEESTTWPLDKQFMARLIKPNTWALACCNPSMDTPRPHVLVGDTYALVIDPTDTICNVRKYVETYITDKPIKVAATHSHGDHTATIFQFDDCEVYMSERCWEDIQESRANRKHPLSKWHKEGTYSPTIVKPGDIIDLGNRVIEVVGINPCHSPSSLLFLDKTYGILFTGDEIDPGQCNLWDIPVETFRDNIQMLRSRADEFDMICAPHNGTPMHAKVLDYFLENCERIMDGVEGDFDKGSMTYLLNPFEPRSAATIERRRWDPIVRRSVWKGTAINYNIHLIFNSQLESYVSDGVNGRP